jgi:hypothetical protein
MHGPGEVERLARLALHAIRPRFEIWAVDHGFSIEPFDKGNPESKYKSFVTQAAFEGWVGAIVDQAGSEK